MKAFRLQLRIAIAVILCSQLLLPAELYAQTLAVTCPNPASISLTCFDDLPSNSGDSLGFVSLPGASISGVTGTLAIAFSEASDNGNGDGSGCPENPVTVTRTFEISDDASSEPVVCSIEYLIEQNIDGTKVTCDDITVQVNEMGEAVINAFMVPYDVTTECGISIDEIFLDETNYSCNDIITSPLSNSLNIVDDCDIVTECNFDVYLLDLIPPDVTCNPDVLINLDPCVCEGIVTFDDPIVSDMCTSELNITITRTDTTNLNSGDIFPVGVTVISYEVEDMWDNTITCSFQVTLNSSDPGSIVCKGDQNISLDQNCEAEVTPEMIVNDPQCDLNSYRVTLFDSDGNEFPDNIIPGEFLGEVITAVASYDCYENSCDLMILVEDKMPPSFDCSDMTINCGEAIDFAIPEIMDNCDNASAVLINEVIADVSCDSVDIDKIVTRTYNILDGNGMLISTCSQDLKIMKFDISDVEAPEQNVYIYCGADYERDENGHPDPSETGAPSLDGIDLWPPKDLICNVSLAYVDTPIPSIPCAQQIIREWTVLNWYCGGDGMDNFIQYITLIDTVAPVFDCPANVTISSAAMSCETMYIVPELDAEDACQADIIIDIAYPGGFVQNTNGLTVELPLGDNEITYRVRDICGRQAACTYIVTVEDNVQPVAICESGMQFGLGGDGTAELLATSFDNGSLDECELATVEIARMDDACGVDGNTEFGESIILCCEDIGNDVMVILQVTDASGNTSQCMSAITVFDEVVPAAISSLPDITVSNDILIDTADLSLFGSIEFNTDAPAEISIDAVSVNFSGPAVNAVIMDNCSNAMIIENKTASLGMCGLGGITRNFTIIDAFGNETSMVQNITVVIAAEFTDDSITWPSDIDTMNICNQVLDPEQIESTPIFNEIFDFRVSYTHEDDTVSYINEACYAIDRHWFVSDWCNRIDEGTFIVFKDTQRITINNSVEPTFTSELKDTLVCSFIPNCGPFPVMLSASGIDDCASTDSLKWTLEIYHEGSILADTIYRGNNFNAELPMGVNTIKWILDDGCGNSIDSSYAFEIESCLNPQPICLAELDFYISNIDTTGDEIADANAVRITPKMIDAGSKHPCGEEISLSFSESLDDTVRIFECEDLGMQPLSLYVTDPEGKFDFCNVFVNVIDTNTVPLCTMGAINGVVFGNDEDFVSEVKVRLGGTDLFHMTDENGFFSFPEMEMGESYTVIPTKIDDPKRGVTTSDLVLIQQHILNVNSFESPYKLIAADVNQSNDISAADLIVIRKLILGRIDEFPNSKTWAFIPGDHIFIDPYQPWSTSVPELYNIPYLNSSMELNFIGVKLGDVNESADMNALDVARRSPAMLHYELNHSASNRLEVKAEEDIEIAALLIDFFYDHQNFKIENIKSFLEGMDFDYYEVEPGHFRLLASDYEVNRIRKDDVLFAIDFDKALEFGDFEKIQFNKEESEIAFEDGSSTSVEFRFVNDQNSIQIKQNTPNPWMEDTRFEVYIPQGEQVMLRISDVSGKLIVNRKINLVTGFNTVKINKDDLPSSGGLFFYEIESSFGKESKKMMLLAH